MWQSAKQQMLNSIKLEVKISTLKSLQERDTLPRDIMGFERSHRMYATHVVPEGPPQLSATYCELLREQATKHADVFLEELDGNGKMV